MKFWTDQKVFSAHSIKRMRAVELAAELTILLIEGPQDKKASVDLYYVKYRNKFPDAKVIESRLTNYFSWIEKALPNFSRTRFRKPVDLYALLGALELVSKEGRHLSRLSPHRAGKNLIAFEKRTKVKQPTGEAAKYLAAASRQ